MRTMQDLDLSRQHVLIREDLNVPISEGVIQNDRRLQAALPSIQLALSQGASVVVLSHLGRPKAGQIDPAYSLAPIAAWFAEKLDIDVPLLANWLEHPNWPEAGQLALCENVRFFEGEQENDPGLAKRYSQGADVFVMDAFATAHRRHASTCAISEHVPVACAGPLLTLELETLDRLLGAGQPPRVAIVGGAKVSTKLQLLSALLTKIDHLIVGGGIANTFLAAAGHAVGCSLHEPDLVAFCRQLMTEAQSRGVDIILPSDVVVAAEVSANIETQTVTLDNVEPTDMILDVGPESATQIAQLIHAAGTVLWNGPLGVFELPAFAAGTRALAEAIKQSACVTVAGGGDTLAAADHFGVADSIEHLSTGGGAFLAYLENTPLPAVMSLTIKNEGAGT